jgi:hypothetical protein
MKIKLLPSPKDWIAFVSENKMELREYLDGLVCVLTANISVCYLNTPSSVSRMSKIFSLYKNIKFNINHWENTELKYI